MAEEEKSTVDVQTEEKAEKKKKKKPWWRRLLKIFAWIFGVILVLLTLLVIFRDFVIRHAVEKVGTYVVGTPVKCGHFSSSLSGKVHIGDLTVGNPEGYHNPHAFKLEKLEVDLNVGTIFSDKIEVRKVYVKGVSVDCEVRLDGSSNLSDIRNNIQKNLERFSPKKPDDGAKSDGEKPADQSDAKSDGAKPADQGDAKSGGEKQVVIRLLKVEDTKLTFSSSVFKTTVPLPLPNLELKDFGEGEPIGQSVGEFFDLIFTSIKEAVTGAGGAVVDVVKGAGGAVVDTVSGIGDALKKVTGGGK